MSTLEYEDRKADSASEKEPSVHEKPEDDARSDAGLQAGLKKVEAVANVWGKWSLVGAYLGIFLVFFVNSLQQQTNGNLTPYVTSAFALHPLVATTGIVSGIIGGVLKLPIAKMIDIWGRAEGYLVMVALATLGLVMMAACKNVETYAAAQVFYWVGLNGMGYVLDVFIADTARLRNRALMWAFASSPYIVTTFAGPSLAQAFLDHSTFRWSFGAFAIITPAVSVPVSVIFLRNQRKAVQEGVLASERASRTWGEAARYYAIEFDVIGMFLVSAGLTLFLLPFSLATYQANKWQSASIIAMIVIGGLLLIAFVLYEKYWSPKSFVPFELLKDRTAAGACFLAGTLFISFYCWDGYFSSLLQVVWGLSVKDAGYVANIYSIGSCFWGIVIGLIIRRTGRFKILALIALPLQMLGAGLMIHFRQPSSPIGYVIMCQIFTAFAGGTLVITEEVAILAADAASHGTYAVSLALLGLSTSIGGAIGSSVSGAIWTNVFPAALEKALPEGSKNLTAVLYGSITEQLAYPLGTPERDAVVHAYGVAQKQMCIVGTCVLILGLGGILAWKDIKIGKHQGATGRAV